jgi:hypothetical protein
MDAGAGFESDAEGDVSGVVGEEGWRWELMML